MCGEQGTVLAPGASIKGSPPRVRGTVFSMLTKVLRRRITPACAGNRRTRRSFTSQVRDHPRVCGEQDAEGDRPGAGVGSPPRVRGTGPVQIDPSMGQGITPACAGNSEIE